MITLPLVTNWNLCTPTLYRYMDAAYVDAFFREGSIRLSSFASFRMHVDEQRLDPNEGRTFFVHRTQQGGGQTITAWATHGLKAYVLCASMRYDEALMSDFGCDSYFRIQDSTAFGMAIAKHIPGLVSAFEGPCLYQERKIVERNLGYIDIDQFRDPRDEEKIDRRRITEFLISKMQHYPLFLKERLFAHQVEYRYVWVVRDRAGDFLDVTVPEAVQHCERGNPLLE